MNAFSSVKILRAALAVTGLSLLGARAWAIDHGYAITSEPVGYVNQVGSASSGTVITTPALHGGNTGHTFVYWKVNGMRLEDARGVALPTARFVLTGSAAAVAVYIRTSDDTDLDNLPDWYEWQQFGSLTQVGSADADSDGLNNATEAARSYGSRQTDILRDGGIATRRTATPVAFTSATDANYTFTSEPAGHVTQHGFAALGTTISTPFLQGDKSGYTFAYWQVNGIRHAAGHGVAKASATFVLSGPTRVTAMYFRSAEDTDVDSVPDWYEWQQFGALDRRADADPDGDGFSVGVEVARGYSARDVDTVRDGGIASRRSVQTLAYISANDIVYNINSEPAGYVVQAGIGKRGDVVITPSLRGASGDYMFAYWKVNGSRQVDATGSALSAVRITLEGPTTATAVYLRTTEDFDADGMPDWFEWQYFGSLTFEKSSDFDADGFSLGIEALRGYSPKSRDRVVDGGVASRRSALSLAYVAAFQMPTITTQPSPQVVLVGETATFVVVATGVPIPSYQWRKDSTPLIGQTAKSLSLPPTLFGDHGSTYDVVVTNAAGSVTSQAVTLTVQSPSQAWWSAYFTPLEINNSAVAGYASDPDRDGLPNLLEYALGSNPRISSPQMGPALGILTVNGERYLTLTATKNPDATDLVLTVQVTSALENSAAWSPNGTIVVTNTATLLVVRDGQPISAATRRFLRLHVSQP